MNGAVPALAVCTSQKARGPIADADADFRNDLKSVGVEGNQPPSEHRSGGVRPIS